MQIIVIYIHIICPQQIEMRTRSCANRRAPFIIIVGGAKKPVNDLYLVIEMSHRSKKKGFGFGGFALQSSFHKAGEFRSWQQGRKEEGWGGKKHRSEEEYVDYAHI